MANFVTDEERYFAACVLDSLIYRSEPQTIALIQQLFQRVLPDLCRVCIPPAGTGIDWLEALNKSFKPDPLVRLVPAVKESDPPTKSAHVIVRLMKRYLNIGEQWMVNPAEVQNCIRSGIHTYLFIDDFCGTGSQFGEFFKEWEFDKLLVTNFMAYVPLACHFSGIQYLSQHFPELHVRPVEFLDQSHSLFNIQAQCFNDGLNSSDGARVFYFDLLKKKKINITGPQRRGYGHLELAYAFSHAAPDNCLPILWWDKEPTWNPLFKR